MSIHKPSRQKVDPQSLMRLKTLHPKIRMVASVLVEKAAMMGIPIYITWAHRSMDVQDALYQMGRTIPGPILTSRRIGHSHHNYGLALDFCLALKGQLYTWESAIMFPYLKSGWVVVAEIFEMAGWQSGYRAFTFEPQHLYYDCGKTIQELYDDYTRGHVDKNGYVKL